MNFIKRDDENSEVNLDLILYFRTHDAPERNRFSIIFEYPKTSITWYFTTKEEKELYLERVETVAKITDLSKMTKL